MSLSTALNVALSGLQTSTAVAQVVAGNIANAQTEGFTAKSVSLSQVSAGANTGGVEIANYIRATNDVLTATANTATTTAAYYETQNSYMTQIQATLDSTGNPPALSEKLSAFQAAWTEFDANPSSPTQAQMIVSAGVSLANLVRTVALQTATMETNVKADLATAVSELNTALGKIVTLNQEIAIARANKQPIVNLQDERDAAVSVVAKYTNATVMERDNEQIALYTRNGTCLLDAQAQTFSVDTDGVTILSTSGQDVTSSLSDGKLQAQTDFLAETATSANGVGVITKLKSQLQNFANLFLATTPGGGSFADAYNSATTDTGEQANNFFTATITASTGMPQLDTFQVNANLVNGTATVKKASAEPISNAFAATNAAIRVVSVSPPVYATTSTFTASGITLQNLTFSGIATGILSGFQQAANTIKDQTNTATTQRDYYKNSLSNETGVNTDEELINLSNWENSYAASAHVISTIQQMMDVLQQMVS